MILTDLRILANIAYSQDTLNRRSTNFDDAVRSFSNELELQLKANGHLGLIRNSPLAITLVALSLWLDDTGNIWGKSDKTADFTSTAECYATVKGTEPKCNIYVAEVISRATGLTHKAHEEIINDIYSGFPATGKYFPYRAAEWADISKSIPYFRVDNLNPKMGDIWAAITEANMISRDSAHVGIYLGEYNAVKLYISARFNGDGVYAAGSVQEKQGIQIKELVDPGERLPPGGVFREFVPPSLDLDYKHKMLET